MVSEKDNSKSEETKKIRIKVVEDTKEDVPSNPDEEVDVKTNEGERVTEEKDTQETPENKESIALVPEEAEVKEEKPLIPIKRNFDRPSFWILFFSFLVGISLGAGLIGGIFYYKSNMDKVTNANNQKTLKPDNTPEVEVSEAEATPPPAEELDLAKLNVNILNGSGIAGEAGRVESLLEKAGFTKTTTGNAKSYGFTETEISFKESVDPAAIDKLKEALNLYKIKEVDNLDDSATYDIEITVGKTKS